MLALLFLGNPLWKELCQLFTRKNGQKTFVDFFWKFKVQTKKFHKLLWKKVFLQGQNPSRGYFEAYCNRASTLRIRRLRFSEMNSGAIKGVKFIFTSEVLQEWNKVIKVISS